MFYFGVMGFLTALSGKVQKKCVFYGEWYGHKKTAQGKEEGKPYAGKREPNKIPIF